MPSNAEMIQQGFGAVGESLNQRDALKRQETERNRPLSGAQKWLAHMAAGRLTPKQAAIAFKLEQQGHSIAEPGGPSGGMQPPDEGLQAPAPVAAQAGTPAPPQMAPPQPGLSAGGAPEFQTQDDFNSLMKAAPFLHGLAAESPEDKMQRLMLTLSSRERMGTAAEEGRNTRASASEEGKSTRMDTRLEARKGEKDAELKYKYDALESKHQDFLARLEQMKHDLQIRGSQAVTVARISAAQRDLANLRNDSAKIRTSLTGLTGDPAAIGQAEQYESQLSQAEQQLDELVRAHDAAPRSRGAKAEQQMQQAPAAQAQPQPAAPPAALKQPGQSPTLKSKTYTGRSKKSGGVMHYELTDGTTTDVPPR